jgi:tetratricopeptide (TPR) repeat protein
MRTTLLAFLLLTPLAAFAQDAGYQKALDQALKDFPPGDYDSGSIPRPRETFGYEGTRAFFKSPEKLEEEILEKAETSQDSVDSLFTSASDYVSSGRYDLALKRYRQILAKEPQNEKAKAGLYDFVILWTLYRTDAPAGKIHDQYKQIEATLKRNAASHP